MDEYRAALVTELEETWSTEHAPRTIRLSVELLDRVMSGVSDMVLARNELARRLRDLPRDVAVEAAFERMSGCIAEIRDAGVSVSSHCFHERRGAFIGQSCVECSRGGRT